jgi:hypothetical protein
MAAAIPVGRQGLQAASAEGPWQRTMLMASQYIAMDDNFVNSLDNDEAIELFGPIDNSSHQCYGWYTNNGDCVPCPDDKPLWWLVLRWLQMMLLKISRSYHAKPLLLMIAPLCAGLLIGYWLGARRAPRTRTGTQRLAPTTAPKSLFRLHRTGSSIQQSLLTICFKVMAYLSEDMSPPTSHEEDKLENCLEARGNDSQTEKSAAKTTNADASTLLPPAVVVADAPLESREDYVRTDLKSDNGCIKESGFEKSQVPRHIAVIMDGNRRYGKQRYGSASRGHWDGSSKLVEFAKWCIAEEISVLTVYAFSTENWNRDPSEVASLMTIFAKYCDELRVEALKRNIKILVLATDMSRVSTTTSSTKNRRSMVHDGACETTAVSDFLTGLEQTVSSFYSRPPTV